MVIGGTATHDYREVVGRATQEAKAEEAKPTSRELPSRPQVKYTTDGQKKAATCAGNGENRQLQSGGKKIQLSY